MITAPILYLHSVSPRGAVELVAANLPYSSLLWNRRLSTVGDFEATLLIPLPAPWPGRYLITASGHDEVGIIEKVEVEETGGTAPAKISGRFMESVWDRWHLSPTESPASGKTWRNAVTNACSSWHCGDVPRLALSDGTAPGTGSAYQISGDVGDSAMDLIYGVTAANGARPLITYDMSAPGDVGLRIVDGVNRTRSQDAVPPCIFSIALASVVSISYAGDVSSAASTVVAYHEGQDGAVSGRDVAVPGFDPRTGWEAVAVEDVGSLLSLSEGAEPTPEQLEQAGTLRAYDHMPVVSIDFECARSGYREDWDLGDLVEVEVPSLAHVAVQRVEEARESYDESGPKLELTAGAKQISKLARAMLGRR